MTMSKTKEMNPIRRDFLTFNFHCDLFCGSGLESMTGTLVVVEP
jgi:heme/copper-type cytochrome/quinol oxidase subunit 2